MSDGDGIFRGSMVAIVTPFKEGAVDYEALSPLLEWHAEQGTHAIVVTGTTGECPTLSDDEAVDLWKFVIEAVGEKMPVIAGAGGNDTAHAIHLSKRAKEVGADALLHVTPYYNKPTQAGLLAHYRAVADATDLPVCLYSVPSRTALAIAPETVAELAKHPNVACLKEAGGSVDRVSEIRQLTDLTIVSGDDALTLPMMTVGAVGSISVSANIIPKENADMIRLATEGRFGAAREIHERIYNLVRTLFIETNPVPVKAALALMGKIRNEFRLPLTPIEAANRERLAEEMRKLDIPVQLLLS
jgi:4-hydroxy-tetrahydrodipicolinate synthase